MLFCPNPPPSQERESQAFRAPQSEIKRLRELVVSHVASLLHTIATDPVSKHPAASSTAAEQLLRDADECFRSAKDLEAAGQEFMKKAVEIETLVQRRKRTKSPRDLKL